MFPNFLLSMAHFLEHHFNNLQVKLFKFFLNEISGHFTLQNIVLLLTIVHAHTNLFFAYATYKIMVQDILKHYTLAP